MGLGRTCVERLRHDGREVRAGFGLCWHPPPTSRWAPGGRAELGDCA